MTHNHPDNHDSINPSIKSRGSIPKWYYPVAVFLLLFLTFVAYHNVFKNQFVYDDKPLIVYNQLLRSQESPLNLFNVDYYQNIMGGLGYYRPLVLLLYRLDYSFWEMNPWGYHLTNLWLHSFNVLLLFFLAQRLVGRSRRKYSDSQNLAMRLLLPFFVALLFALHPSNSSVVAPISAREDMLCFFFYLCAMLIYSGRNGWYRSFLTPVFFLLALISKEPAVTLLPVLVGFDFIAGRCKLNRKYARHFLTNHLPLLAVFLLYLSIRWLVFGKLGSLKGGVFLPLDTVIMVASSYLYYWQQFIAPSLGLIYEPQTLLEAAPSWKLWLVTVILVVILCFYYPLKKIKIEFFPLFTLFWVLVAIGPTSNIAFQETVFDERYLYIPSAGFSMFVLWTAARLLERYVARQRELLLTLLVGTTVLLVPLLLYITWQRNQVWETEVKLFSQKIRVNPNDLLGYKYLSWAYIDKGNYKKAEFFERRYSFLVNRYILTGIQKAKKMFAKGEQKEALALMTTLLRRCPYCSQVYPVMARFSQEMGHFNQAILYLQALMRLAPGQVKDFYQLGELYKQTGQEKKAKEFYKNVSPPSSQKPGGKSQKD